MNVTEFLQARIAEDEAIARAAAASPSGDTYDGQSDPVGPIWEASNGMILGGRDSSGYRLALWDCEGSATLQMNPAAATHAAHHDPARALIECAAKRQVIELHEAFGRHNEPGASAMWHATGAVLKNLATVYSDHRDYQPEWMP